MKNKKQFGEIVEGYSIPVLNEREIRAAAGIMFLATFISLMEIMYRVNFVPIKYIIVIFFLDFSIRLFINPKLAPLLIVSRWIVSNQNSEYVGAAQKKFAWYIGFILSGIMLFLMVFLNTYSIISGIICLSCLILMFFEAAFGICLGCYIYKLVKKENAKYCPGEVCDINEKHEIQKIGISQIGIVFLLFLLIVFISFLFTDKFSEKPQNLFQISNNK